jgi:four helix bundle protein
VLGSLFSLLNPPEEQMEKTNFEKLRVYQLSERLADNVWNIVIGWEYLPQATVGQQLVRSVDSIGANVAEGTGRGSIADNRRFVRIARGSLYETKHWLRRAFKRNLLTEGQVSELKPMIDELSPRLNAYYKSIDAAARESRNIKSRTTN